MIITLITVTTSPNSTWPKLGGLATAAADFMNDSNLITLGRQSSNSDRFRLHEFSNVSEIKNHWRQK